jgi:hypothetical protein
VNNGNVNAQRDKQDERSDKYNIGHKSPGYYIEGNFLLFILRSLDCYKSFGTTGLLLKLDVLWFDPLFP